MSYPTFLKNINIISDSISDLEKNNRKIIGINLIIIFQGLNWSNIVHLFKINNIIINNELKIIYYQILNLVILICLI